MRFRKSVKIGKGVKVNFSKSGASLSLGGRGHSVNLGSKGARTTVGMPGTGLSYSTRIGGKSRTSKAKRSKSSPREYQVTKSEDIIADEAYTNEQPNAKRKTWLWILGWLFAFPLMLTILLLRNIKKNTIIKIVVIAAAWLLFSVFITALNSDTSPDAQELSRSIGSTNITKLQAENTSSEIKELKISSTKDVTVKVGQTTSSGNVQVKVKSTNNFLPEDVIFVSENPEVATIELKNVSLTTYLYYEIKGIGAGETTVYALSADGSVESEHIKVTVTEPVGVDAIAIENVKTDLVISETTSPKVKISPYNAEAKALTWRSSDETVAIVDSNGVVTALGDGTATITAKAPNGVEASFDVNVDGTKTLMNLRVTRQRLDDYNIGDDWNYDIRINGEKRTGNIGIAEGEQLSFTAEFTENDKRPDVGKASQNHYVTEEDIANGFSVSMDVYVTENGGQNSSKSAHFVVTFEFTPN